MRCIDKVRHLDPCLEAVEWMEDRTEGQVWDECPHPHWLIWWAGKMAGQKGWISKENYIEKCKSYVNELYSNKVNRKKKALLYIERYKRTDRIPQILDGNDKRVYDLLDKIKRELKPNF